MIRLKKSRFAFDSELVQKQNLFAFDYVQNNFHTTTVYLSDDKSQLSSQSLGYSRVIVCIQLHCIIIFSPDFFFLFGIDLIPTNKINSHLNRDLIRKIDSHLLLNWFWNDSIHKTKIELRAFGAELVRFTHTHTHAHTHKKKKKTIHKKKTRLAFDSELIRFAFNSVGSIHQTKLNLHSIRF